MSEIYSEEPPVQFLHDVEMQHPENEGQLQGSVLWSLNESAIWLNGYHCVRPSEEFLRDLGATVLTLLNNPENTLPALDLRVEDLNQPIPPERQAAQCLYLKIYKS